MVSAQILGRSTHVLSLGLLLLSASGCVATRGWVQERMTPLNEQMVEVQTRLGQTETRATQATGRMSEVEARLGQTAVKADLALKNLENLRLEQRFVVGVKEGVGFATNASGLTAETRQAIDGFLRNLGGANDVTFLVAGHTDSIGSMDYNHTLAQKRAASVARYLITEKGIDPLRVAVASYGESAPLADNVTPRGRQQNRRVEILLYRNVITSTPGGQRIELERTSHK
jgi:outer membrane protein OmpA-like peptidoglycan-associated protein